jgi:hypothetical protein
MRVWAGRPSRACRSECSARVGGHVVLRRVGNVPDRPARRRYRRRARGYARWYDGVRLRTRCDTAPRAERLLAALRRDGEPHPLARDAHCRCAAPPRPHHLASGDAARRRQHPGALPRRADAHGRRPAADQGRDRRARDGARRAPRAGVAGSGAGTSLNGVAPALLLTRDRLPPVALIADLAAYFVISNTIGLGVLTATGGISTRALWPACVLWVPGAVAGNLAGVAVAPRVPEQHFRRLTLAVVFVAGAVTIATSY